MGGSRKHSMSDNGASGEQQDEATRDPKRKDAEFLFVGVRKAYRGQKIGSGVFDTSVIFCREREIDRVIAIVEHTNRQLHDRANYHVARYGYRCIRQMELNGRLMDVVEMDLTRELPPEEWGPSTLDPDVLPNQ